MLARRAPAKINRFLHVVGRRGDGYHLLQTLFQFLDLADTLSFRPRDDGRLLRVTDVDGVAPEDDLVIRAAAALRDHAGSDAGVEIGIDKAVPMGGGLGGGSSDAATTLLALNELWGTHLETAELAEIGLGLGADVPIFVHGHAAFAEGVGEVLTGVSPPEGFLVLVHPGVTVATAEVFGHPDLERATPCIDVATALQQGGHNDCEAVVRALHPEVADALDWLRQFGAAMLTGTGACVFLPCRDLEQATLVAAGVPLKWRVWVTRVRNQAFNR